ncbi:hypothetical protein [Pseudoclavibacter helvolus]|uniref:hypothetical protein n=1 Tax=Pseudoclavibacter helvolus TaxID=255205 RepID=UPI0008392ED2|nr:hypothetical protein [Pseudoclavibacter helvolus]
MSIKTVIAEALRKRGITPEAPLVNLHPTSDIWSDQRTLVVKVGYEPTRWNYLHDLGVLTAAGVRCEKPLIDDVIEIEERHAIVVGYITPDRPPRASDAEAVGALLRAVHEATLASDSYEAPRRGHVFFPDDWLSQNIVIHDGLPYLVDLDLWRQWERERAIIIACGEFLRDLAHTSDDIAAFRRGYGEFS